MEEEISFHEIFLIIKKHLLKIMVWCFLGILLLSAYTFFFVTPVYQSTSKIVVNQKQNSNQVITGTDIQTNLSLIKTYQSILKEPIILEPVLEEMGGELTLGELREKITVETESDSLVFGVSIKDENPYQASEISNAITDSFAGNIGGILDVQNVTILSEGEPNLQPISPNIILNVAAGGFLGLILGFCLALYTEYRDKTVKEEKFIESLGLVHLGSVLEMSLDEVKNTRISKSIPGMFQSNSRVTKRRV